MSEGSGPTQFERNWAMIAHLTALVTVAAGLATGGVAAVFALLVPLGMYVYFRQRSPYVAFHALQSTAFQAIGGILFAAVAAVTGLVLAGAWIITGALSLVLIGLLLVPVSILLTLAAALVLLGLPFIMLAYALRGAYLTYAGEPFEYPWLGELVARTMEAPFTTTAPAGSS